VPTFDLSSQDWKKAYVLAPEEGPELLMARICRNLVFEAVKDTPTKAAVCAVSFQAGSVRKRLSICLPKKKSARLSVQRRQAWGKIIGAEGRIISIERQTSSPI
jgi:hypothetical protein